MIVLTLLNVLIVLLLIVLILNVERVAVLLDFHALAEPNQPSVVEHEPPVVPVHDREDELPVEDAQVERGLSVAEVALLCLDALDDLRNDPVHCF